MNDVQQQSKLKEIMNFEKSIILFGSEKKLTKSHHLVTRKQLGRQYDQPSYYVRAKLFNGNVDEALDKAKPMPGETVLNTVPIG